MSIVLARVSSLVIAATLQSLSVAPPNPIPDDAHQNNLANPLTRPHRQTETPVGPVRDPARKGGLVDLNVLKHVGQAEFNRLS